MSDFIKGIPEEAENFKSVNSDPSPFKEKTESEYIDDRLKYEKKLDGTQTFNEQEFIAHQKRFKKKVKKPGPFSRGLSYMDVVREEALRANEDWNKKYFLTEKRSESGEIAYKKEIKAEYKGWMELLKPVMRNMKLKRDNPESEEAKKIKILKINMGGGMSGANAGGQEIAEIDMGFYPERRLVNGVLESKEEWTKRKVFEWMLGISVGSAVSGYVLGGREQAIKGASLFTKECIDNNAINPKRFWQIFDVGYVVGKMKKGDKKLDVDAIAENPTELYVQVADPKTGKPRMENAKQIKEGILEGIHGSMALPWLYINWMTKIFKKKQVRVNEQDVIDGGIEPLPIHEIIEQFKGVTDIIIQPNIPFDEAGAFTLDFKEQLIVALTRLFPKSGSSVLAQKVLLQKEELRKVFEYIKRETGINICILWPPNTGLSTITRDADDIYAGLTESYRETLKIFEEEHKFKGVENYNDRIRDENIPMAA